MLLQREGRPVRRLTRVTAVVVGVVVALDGWSRLREPAATIADFDRWGAPVPQTVGPLLVFLEVVVGAGLVAAALFGRRRWGVVAAVGLVPAVVALGLSYDDLVEARCDDETCPGRVADRASDADGEATRLSAPRTVVDGLEFPTAIGFLPDGRMLVNERAGRVRVVRDGRLDPRPVATIPTTTAGERGLLGLAVAPDGESVYVFATDPDGDSNRVLRIPLTGGQPAVVVADLPGGVYHDGGGLAFDRSGLLLVSNGEVHERSRAQDPNALGGKVYRYTLDGRPAPDGPYGGGSPALAIGLRNPFGLAVDPVSGAAFVTENGPTGHDELNRVDPGMNYGWPAIAGLASDGSRRPARYQDPLIDYPRTVVPTGIAFSPAGELFFGTYGEGTIHRVRLDASRRRVAADEVVLDAGEPVVGLTWGPEGLYFSTPEAVRVITTR